MSKIRTYKAQGAYNQGLMTILSQMFENLKKSRELLWELFKRDIKGKYKQSLLGWFWIILSPLVAVATFFILNKSGVIRVGSIEAPYVLYGLIGITFWQVFSNGLNSVTVSITSAGSLIQKINFPNEVLVISSLGQTIPDLLVRLFLILILFFLYGRSPDFYFWISPLMMLPIFLLTLGLGFLTSMFNVVVRDVSNFIGSVMGLLLFLTPIMYVLPKSGVLGKVSTYNPLFYLVVVPRDLILKSKTEYLQGYMVSSVIAVVIFLLGWFIFHISQKKLVERL